MTNSQRGFAPILIVLLIIAGAAVAGGGYYVVAKHRASVKVAQSAKSQSPEPTASTSPTPSPSASATVVYYYGAEITPAPGAQGWPIKIKATIPIKGRIQASASMAVVTAVPTTPVPGQFTLIISGFPANTNLYVYTNGYRNVEVKRSSFTGTLTFALSSNLGGDFIIKDTSS